MTLLADLLAWLGRPARRCGIHGEDTSSGRCSACDANRQDSSIEPPQTPRMDSH